MSSDIKAPPLGNLDRGPVDDPSTTGIYTDRSKGAIVADESKIQGLDTTGAIEIPVPQAELNIGSTEPVATQGTFQNPGVIDRVADPSLPGGLAGDESTPFLMTGQRAGTVGSASTNRDPLEGIVNHQVMPEFTPGIVGDPRVVVANGRPMESYQWSDGLTQSQLSARDFFREVDNLRVSTPPRLLPALQYTPQELDPSRAGGFAPTAETKGPYSWFIDGPQDDVNLFTGQYGASGGGLLGGLGWFFGRISPTTHLKGAALDVARSAAAGWEGANAAVGELLKGNFGGSLNAFTDAASENFYANSPLARGMPGRKIGGSKELGEDFAQSYFLSGLVGLNDTSFSGAGNRAGQRTVAQGESFNPFGFRDQLRSAEGGYIPNLQAKERAKGAGPLHGYDQLGLGLAGLAADVFLEGRIDKVVSQAFGKATSTASKAVPTPTSSTTSTYTYKGGYKPPSSPIPPLVPYKRPGVQSAPIPSYRPPTNIPPLKARPYVDTKNYLPATIPITGPKTPAILRELDTTARSNGAIVHVPRVTEYIQVPQPITTRWSPPNINPFTMTGQQARVYTPTRGPGGVDFPASSGGAIVPYVPPSGSDAISVPAVLGVGSAPGELLLSPAKTRVLVTPSSDPTLGVLTTPPPYTVTRLADEVLDGELLEDTVSATRMPSEPTQVLDGQIVPETSLPRLPEAPTPLSLNPGTPSTRVLRTPPPRVQDPRVLITPAHAPNYTVRPSAISPDDTVRASHTVDESTGTFKSTQDVAQVAVRKTAPTPSTTVKVEIPEQPVKYVTAEAISPSVSSADIIRRLTDDSIEGAIYNPRQVSRGTRTLPSLATLARRVTLPNGVRILDDGVKDSTVSTWARLSKRVESAILASGLNPSGSEAQSIRRLFDRVGKPIPTNLDPNFAIEVGVRSIDEPQTLVRTATPASKETQWTGSAANYTPRYPLSEEYGISMAVRKNAQGKYVPVDHGEMKSYPPKSSTKTVETSPIEIVNIPTSKISTNPESPKSLKEIPIADRQAVVGAALAQGGDIPKSVIDDAMNPEILTDPVAAKEYSRANLPKESQPVELNREARTTLEKHSELLAEVDTTNAQIVDVATQLADAERSLTQYLKKVDQLPDVGVKDLTDDVPPSPLPPVAERGISTVESPVTREVWTAKSPQVTHYHGTRVKGLALESIDPLSGASRSELGTGVWLTTDKGLATSASGRPVPANVVPNVKRVFSDESFIHEIPKETLKDLVIPHVDETIKDKYKLLEQLTKYDDALSEHIPYGEELTSELFEVLNVNKSITYSELFEKVDDATYKVANRILGADPDELELTYVQRVVTDLLKGTGVQGLTNNLNTVVYDTRSIRASYIHDVTDITGDASDDIATSLHEVNLLQRSLEVQPTSRYLQVQLAEARAIAASKIRDSLEDTLTELEGIKTKQMSDLLDYDDVVTELAQKQRTSQVTKATLRDESTIQSFTKELSKKWEGPCL